MGYLVVLQIQDVFSSIHNNGPLIFEWTCVSSESIWDISTKGTEIFVPVACSSVLKPHWLILNSFQDSKLIWNTASLHCRCLVISECSGNCSAAVFLMLSEPASMRNRSLLHLFLLHMFYPFITTIWLKDLLWYSKYSLLELWSSVFLISCFSYFLVRVYNIERRVCYLRRKVTKSWLHT